MKKKEIERMVNNLPEGFRSYLETYKKIAFEEPVSDQELESLRRTLVEGLKALPDYKLRQYYERTYGHKYAEDNISDLALTLERLVPELESACSKSEKVIAIDQAISIEHGEGNVLMYVIDFHGSRDEVLDLGGHISDILEELAA